MTPAEPLRHWASPKSSTHVYEHLGAQDYVHAFTVDA
jgi:hypothetical protein